MIANYVFIHNCFFVRFNFCKFAKKQRKNFPMENSINIFEYGKAHMQCKYNYLFPGAQRVTFKPFYIDLKMCLENNADA